MKTPVARPKLILPITLLSVIAGIVFVSFFTPAVVSAYKIYWLLPITALIILFLPFGNKKLQSNPNDTPEYPLIPWLLRIVTIELSLFAVFWGISTVAGKIIPVLTTPRQALFTHTSNFLLLNTGLFPWVGIALVAAIIGYISYYHNQDAHFSTIFKPLFKSKPTQTIGLIINFTARITTWFVFSSSVGFISLLLISLMVPKNALHWFTGFHPVALVLMLIVLLVTLNKQFNQRITALLDTKKITPKKLILLFTLGLTAVLTLLIFFFGGDSHTISQTAVIKTPKVISFLLNQGWINLWNVFASVWWLSWIPIAGIFIAKISKGYRIRSVIMATMGLPLALSLIIFFTHQSIQLHTNHLLQWIAVIIPVIGFVTLISIFWKKESFPLVRLSYLPKQGLIRHRQYSDFVCKLLQFSVAIIYFYLPAGMTFLSVFSFIATFIFSIFLLFLPFALGVRAFCRLSKTNPRQPNCHPKRSETYLEQNERHPEH